MSFRLKYNAVVVIQSLFDDDKQTGKELFDDIIYRRCEQTKKASYFYNPSNKVEFLTVFEEICALVINDDLYPIIHFEIHGNPNGIILESSEAVTWEELQHYCRLINIQVCNQLIITLATCYGSRIWKMIDVTKPAPYWGYIGPKETIGEVTLMEDFQSFYDSLLTQESLNSAIKELKINGTRDKYVYLHCEGIFEYHIERNMKDIPLDKKATYKRLMKKTIEILPGMNRAQRKNHLKNSLSKFDRNSFIDRIKKNFLMT